MLARAAFGLVVALASVSVATAAPRTVSGSSVGAESGDYGRAWGFTYTPPQENNAQAIRKSYGAYTGAQSEPRAERSDFGPAWGFPAQEPANRR